jgi:importin subunit beta-1
VLDVVEGLSTEILSRLQVTLEMQSRIVGTDDRSNLEELQINLLGLLTNIIRRVNEQVNAGAERLMTLFLELFENKLPNSLIEEDIYIAIGAVAGAVGENFKVFMPAFMPYLVRALHDSEYQTCNTAIGLVADICHALGPLVQEYCRTFMETFLENLRKDDIRREIKPMILSCIGDIASSIGTGFIPYLDGVMSILAQASILRADQEMSMDFYDYVDRLRESLIDAYVGIVAGLRDSPAALLPYIKSIFDFLAMIQLENDLIKSETVLRSVVGLIGDIASMYQQGEVRSYYQQTWVTDVIRRARSSNYALATKETAKWAREQQKKQTQL